MLCPAKKHSLFGFSFLRNHLFSFTPPNKSLFSSHNRLPAVFPIRPYWPLLLLLLIGTGCTTRPASAKQSLQVAPSQFPHIKDASDFHALAERLVQEMSLREKIRQLYGEPLIKGVKFLSLSTRNRFPHIYVGQNRRLHIPPWVLSDGPRGARVMDRQVNGVTTFPVAMARGASWDTELEGRINEAIAIEMRANGTNYAATPCINLLRHPGWGRAQESYGEDPWLLGEFGVAAVRGIQKHDVMACPKHFALNSLENSRFVLNVTADERTLREVYLPHFRKTIQQGKPASIMSAYNQVNGAYCAQNKYLLSHILREEWGFEGFVTSDWFYGTHDGAASVQAGLDVEMPFRRAYRHRKLRKAIRKGNIREANIDTLVLRSLRTRLPYAFAKDSTVYSPNLIGQAAHRELAREAAEKSMVLLKNEGVLPFSDAPHKKIAVIGRLANAENTGDHGSSDATALYVVTPFAGIQSYHADKGNEVVLYDGTDLQVARKIATEADEVILVVGYTFEDEGEYMLRPKKMARSARAGELVTRKGLGGDRESLRLPAFDEELISTLSGLSSPLVVIYVGGSAIDLSAWDAQVPAILFAWYAGMEGGHALAHVLYGEVNPSGKLPFSIPRNASDYPEWNPYTDEIHYGYFHGYTLFDRKKCPVAYPFGYGLSYTSFSYSNLTVAAPTLQEDEKLGLELEVRNTGDLPGAEIVQLYVGFAKSEVERPVKLLRGFKKVFLEPGETKTVTLEVPAADLAWYNPTSEEWQVEKMDYEIYVGSSSAPEDLLQATFRVE